MTHRHLSTIIWGFLHCAAVSWLIFTTVWSSLAFFLLVGPVVVCGFHFSSWIPPGKKEVAALASFSIICQSLWTVIQWHCGARATAPFTAASVTLLAASLVNARLHYRSLHAPDQVESPPSGLERWGLTKSERGGQQADLFLGKDAVAKRYAIKDQAGVTEERVLKDLGEQDFWHCLLFFMITQQLLQAEMLSVRCVSRSFTSRFLRRTRDGL